MYRSLRSLRPYLRNSLYLGIGTIVGGTVTYFYGISKNVFLPSLNKIDENCQSIEKIGKNYDRHIQNGQKNAFLTDIKLEQSRNIASDNAAHFYVENEETASIPTFDYNKRKTVEFPKTDSKEEETKKSVPSETTYLVSDTINTVPISSAVAIDAVNTTHPTPSNVDGYLVPAIYKPSKVPIPFDSSGGRTSSADALLSKSDPPPFFYYFSNQQQEACLKHYPTLLLPSYENVIVRNAYMSSVNYRYRIANWVAERLTSNTFVGEGDRSAAHFKSDPSVPLLWRAMPSDYRHSNFYSAFDRCGICDATLLEYCRGHLAAAASHKHSQQFLDETFYLSANIVPQHQAINKGVWYQLEYFTRQLTNFYSDVYCISGPVWLSSSLNSDRNATVKDRVADTSTNTSTQRLDGEAPTEAEGGKIIIVDDVGNATINRTLGKVVAFNVLGEREVAVPSHLFKIIVAVNPIQGATNTPTISNEQLNSSKYLNYKDVSKLVFSKKKRASSMKQPIVFPPAIYAAFLVPNYVGSNDTPSLLITDYETTLQFIEWSTGLNFAGLKDFIRFFI